MNFALCLTFTLLLLSAYKFGHVPCMSTLVVFGPKYKYKVGTKLALLTILAVIVHTCLLCHMLQPIFPWHIAQ